MKYSHHKQLSLIYPAIHSLKTAIILLSSAMILCAAGFLNRYPLLNPDSLEYISVGRNIYQKIMSGQSGWFGQRSPFYSLWTYLLHQDHSLWCVILGQGFLLSYIIWVCFRKMFPRFSDRYFLIIISIITISSSVSWFTSFLMADIFAAILILGVFILGFGNLNTDRCQNIAVSAIVILSITVHTSHLLVAIWLFLAVMIIHWHMRTSRNAWALSATRLLVTIAVSIVLMLISTGFLYNKAGLIGPHPPFLLARIISDGPGKTYLQNHCPSEKHTICKYMDLLTDNHDDFLWKEKGVMRQASAKDAHRIQKEEMQIVYATVRNHPLETISVATENFIKQSVSVGPKKFNAHPYTEANIIKAFPKTGEQYFHSRQYLKTLPYDSLLIIQRGILLIAALICLFIGLQLRNRLPEGLIPLTVLIVMGLFGNNLITGVLSCPVPRYQSRVIWLVPLLALFYIFAWIKDKRIAS